MPRSEKRPSKTASGKHHSGKGDDLRTWKIVCASERFNELRSNPAFHRLLELSRHVNTLRYGIAAVYAIADEDTPWAARQRSSTFFYHGGILYEAFTLIPELRTHFEHLPQWRDGFAKFGDDDAIRSRLKRGGDLHTLRNHTSFHVISAVAPKSLKTLNMAEYVFATGRGKKGGEVYHNLGDIVALHYAIGCPQDKKDFDREFVRIATETRDLALNFLTASELLIGGALGEMGFTISYDAVM